MKKILTALFCISSLAFSSPLYAHNETTCKQVKFQSTDSTWAGHYYLQGVMEVGSELCRRNMVEKWQLYWFKSSSQICQKPRNIPNPFRNS